jgi:hypothetical protein
MANDLESLKIQLASLEQAQLSSVLSVRFEDQQVTYRSAEDMIKVIEYLRRRIYQLENPHAARTRYSVARFTCR